MNKTTSTMIAVALAMWAGLGCSDDTSPSNNSRTNSSTNMATNTGDTALTSDTGGTSPTTPTGNCTATLACSAGMCGTMDDGCGGVINCGLCACDDGSDSGDTSCGPCGLGKKVCKSGSMGAATCSIEDLEAFGLPGTPTQEQCAQSLVFVESGAQGGRGTKEKPYGSWDEAAAVVTSGQIVVMANGAEFTGSLRLVDGVHILGGIARDGETWIKDDARTRIKVAPASDDPTVGILAKGLAKETLLSGLDLEILDAQGSAMVTHVGIMVWGEGRITLADSKVTVGQPNSGMNGTDGKSGVAGGAGTDGTPGLTGIIPDRVGWNEVRPDAGVGGMNLLCQASGGAGGRGGGHTKGYVGSPGSSFIPPESGQPGLGLQGANGGAASPGDPLVAGQNGGRGQDGSMGMAGSAVPASNPFWEVIGEGGPNERLSWRYEYAGGNGVLGPHGGGGGGGGGQSLYTYLTTAFQDGLLYWSWGPSAGGGAAGGCGGEPGTGGGVGGSAFGAVVQQGTLSLIGSEILAKVGGRGGDGGTGGVGGVGGVGGSGARYTLIYPRVSDGSAGDVIQTTAAQLAKAGDGGDGGKGGKGGPGAGGTGGASVGVYCSGTGGIVTDESSSVRGEGAAPGGASQGNTGASGLYKDRLGCD